MFTKIQLETIRSLCADHLSRDYVPSDHLTNLKGIIQQIDERNAGFIYEVYGEFSSPGRYYKGIISLNTMPAVGTYYDIPETKYKMKLNKIIKQDVIS